MILLNVGKLFKLSIHSVKNVFFCWYLVTSYSYVWNKIRLGMMYVRVGT